MSDQRKFTEADIEERARQLGRLNRKTARETGLERLHYWREFARKELAEGNAKFWNESRADVIRRTLSTLENGPFTQAIGQRISDLKAKLREIEAAEITASKMAAE